jgi:Flp pilus assembly protein TadD
MVRCWDGNLRRVSRLDPSWAKLWSRKGYAHYHMKQYDEAAAAFAQHVALEPQHEEARRNVHRAELAGGDAAKQERRQRVEQQKAAVKRGVCAVCGVVLLSPK